MDTQRRIPEAMAPLGIGNFRWLWTTSMISNVGSFVQTVAASWLMLELTHSPTWVGAMVASRTLPVLFLALVAGAAADMIPRTRLLIASQSLMGGSALAMAILTASGRITPGLLLGLGLLMGVGVAFNMPAWQATVPDLVPRDLVASAVALNSISFNVARAIGPALGGLIVATIGPAAGFGLNALSYLGVIATLAVLSHRITYPELEASSVVNAIGLGVRFARYTRPFRHLLLLASLFAITSASVQAVLPNRTNDLGGDAAVYGLLLGAMGAGALVGGLTRSRVVRLGRLTIPVAIAVFGFSGVAVGAAPGVPLAMMAMAVAGAAWVWTLSTLNATAQLMSPEWVRGRAMGLYSLSFAGVFPLGSLLAGWVAGQVGAGPAMVLLSLGAVVVGVSAIGLHVPALSEVERPRFETGRTVPPHADTLDGGPVMVLNTWQVDPERIDEFLRVMADVRAVRLRTGAYRWRLYRDAGDPTRLTEAFLTTSWREHLHQHQRIDDASRELLLRARSFDRNGSPVTHHLVAVDLEHPADWDRLTELHADLHRSDGSIPLPGDGHPPATPEGAFEDR